MRHISIVAILTTAPAFGVGIPGEIHPVDISLEDNITPAKRLGATRNLVTTLFGNAGVEIRWLAAPTERALFRVRVVECAPTTASPEAMAATRIDQKSVTVYSDRVQRRLGKAHPAAAKVALAYVIAHELAHAMQGIPRHSESGILKAQWTNDDFTAMLFGRLQFAVHDLVMIRNGCLRALVYRNSKSPKQE